MGATTGRRLDDPGDLPSGPGAYLLAVVLDRPLLLAAPGGGRAMLRPGLHAYAGSACGPGGMRARVGRHLRVGKTVRWHVDRLTEAAGVAFVAAFPDGHECGLLAGLLRRPSSTVPVARFGASDCRLCPAHLVRLDEDGGLAALADGRALAALVRAAGAKSWISWRPPSAGGRGRRRRGRR